MILFQTEIFNVLSSSVQLENILKNLTIHCDRQTISFIPARGFWVQRLTFLRSNESKNSCLSIDCRKSGPAKYKTNANGKLEQFCYYGQNKKDRLFNKLLAKRVAQNNNTLVFQIDSVINVTENGETKIYKAVQELKSLVKQNKMMDKTGVVTDNKLQINLNSLIRNTLKKDQKMGEDLDFLLSNNASQPKKKKVKLCNTTRISCNG